MSRYSPELLDHFQHPRNTGVLEAPDGATSVSNPQCGDMTKLFLRVTDGRIVEVRWQTRGCSASIAASSAVSELAAGLPLAEAAAITRQAIAEALGGLAPAQLHSCTLAEDALRAALADYHCRTFGLP